MVSVPICTGELLSIVSFKPSCPEAFLPHPQSVPSVLIARTGTLVVPFDTPLSITDQFVLLSIKVG